MNNKKLTGRQAANRANAAKSTGPKTEEGKKISSHNALKTGLTGRTVLLPTDDLEAYEAHLASIEERYQPTTDEERFHAQNIAHIEWRILRIPTLETGLLALGRKRFAHTHAEEPADIRAVLIEAEVQFEFQKPLANLAVQESRLNRQHERELEKLNVLQTARRKLEASRLEEAARFYTHCKDKDLPFDMGDLAMFGFEFSLEQIQRRVAHHLVARDRDHVAWPTIKTHYCYQLMQQQDAVPSFVVSE